MHPIGLEQNPPLHEWLQQSVLSIKIGFIINVNHIFKSIVGDLDRDYLCTDDHISNCFYTKDFQYIEKNAPILLCKYFQQHIPPCHDSNHQACRLTLLHK